MGLTGCQKPAKFDANGSAIIVHEKPVTYGEEESDTGNRVACGVIQRN